MKRKRHSKSAFQQCRYYEVDNIFEYMVETYINGNFWKSHSTLTLLATQNYPFLLKYDCPLWLK